MKRRLFTSGLFAAGLTVPGVLLSGQGLAQTQKARPGVSAAKR